MPRARITGALIAALTLALAAPAAHAQDPTTPTDPPAWWWQQDDPSATDPAATPTDTTPTDPYGDGTTTTPDPTATDPWLPGDQTGTLPVQPEQPQVELVRTPTVAGRVAKLRSDGKAAIPRGAPKQIRTLIAAMNRIVGKPYLWGGGHAKLIDRGYDCSGAVSYGLIGAGMLQAPQVSGTLAHFGAAGPGRWVTIYANKGHVYLEVAGMRLDTSPVGDLLGGRDGVRWRSLIGKRSGFHVRHPVGF